MAPRDQRDETEHRILQEAEREHTRDGVAAARALAPERPVVDGEAAGASRRCEDAEPGHDRLRRGGEVELGPLIDARHVAERQDVAPVGRDLAGEAGRQPDPGVARVDDADHLWPPRRSSQRQRHAERGRGGGDHDCERLLLEAEEPAAQRPSRRHEDGCHASR